MNDMDLTNFNQIKAVYQMLEDEESREIYIKRVNYLLTDDFRFFRDVIDTYLPDVGPGKARNLDGLLAALPEDREFVLFGAGRLGQSMLRFVEHDKRFKGFCSSTKRRQEHGCSGHPVMSPEELIARKDLTVMISAAGRARLEILEILKDGDYPRELIVDRDSSMTQAVYNSEQYFCPDFIKYEDEEIFADVGCLNLGSSLKLKEYCRHLKKVYAFEPDEENYKRCVERKEALGDTETVVLPYGAWSERTELSFDGGLMGSSSVCAEGEGAYHIPVIPIDEAISAEDKVTFIKMDIEGSELEALKGARETILRNKPKLAICIYHKPEDMWTIPLFIKELVPEYKLYVRHYSSGPDETVLHAVMP